MLDLSNRNPQLNYNVEAKRKIEVVHPDQSAIFKHLVISGKDLEFIKVFDPRTVLKAQDVEGEDMLAVWEERLKTMHEEAITRATRAARKSSTITRKDDQALETLLRGLLQQSKTYYEEKGVQILFLTLGMVSYPDPSDRKTTRRAPLLFVPARVHRENVLSPFKLSIQDDEVIVNPSLKEKMRVAFNLELPEFPDEFTEASLGEYLEKVQRIVESGHEDKWLLEERVFIDKFFFAKLSLYYDLKNNEALFQRHAITRAIASGGGYSPDTSKLPSLVDLSDEAPMISSHTILDSDSSQFDAIQHARRGASLVIGGPPGTGKSQCITNIIAECIGEGKTVLFVSQKQAALDVVKKRLDSTGIGMFCLDLHDQKSNKKEIIDQIITTLDMDIERRRQDDGVYHIVPELKHKLNEYATSMNTRLGARQLTMHEIIGLLGKIDRGHPGLPLVDAVLKNVHEIDEQALFKIKDELARLWLYRHVVERFDTHPWSSNRLPRVEPGFKQVLLARGPALVESVDTILAREATLRDRCATRRVTSTAGISRVVAFLDEYHASSLSFDASGFLETFHREYRSFARWFKPAFYNDRKIVAALVKAPRGKKPERILEDISRRTRDLLDDGGVARGLDELEPLARELHDLARQVDAGASHFRVLEFPSDDWTVYKDGVTEALDNIDTFDEWFEVMAMEARLRALGAGDFVVKLYNQVVEHDYPTVFMKTYLRRMLDHGFATFPRVRSFNDQLHERDIKQFIEKDQECIKNNPYRLAMSIKQRHPVPDGYFADTRSSEMGILRREHQKKRNIKPIRKIMESCKNLIAKAKPCMMMGPLSVAGYLSLPHFYEFFDTVVFDEASQLLPEDAIGAIVRGKQVVVVGDDKQLPPTSFFHVSTEDEDDEDIDMFESILQECRGLNMVERMLRWHYRSRKEGLIAFSNHHYYNNQLNTFPDTLKSPGTGSSIEDMSAVEHVFVDGGVYDKGKSKKNKIEARAVVDAMLAHFKSNARRDKKASLGVIALSSPQQDAIEDLLYDEMRADPAVETLISEQDCPGEPYFIKNLENVQGDERDVILMSVGYGKDASNKLSLNFGPINKSGGERRLNVAITRARIHVKVFSSFLPADVDLSRTGSVGFKNLISYLEYARGGTVFPSGPVRFGTNLAFDSPFEEEVHQALVDLGYEVDTQIGCSGYRIDLAVVHPDTPSRYILGIECDGASYHSSRFARDRDRLRHQVLEGLGWTIMHVWSPTWFKDRASVLTAIDARVQALRATNRAGGTSPAGNGATRGSPGPVGIRIRNGRDGSNGSNGSNGGRNRRDLLSMPGVQEYRVASRGGYNQASFYNSIVHVKNVVQSIINEEGPIHEDLLVKRVKEAHGFKRGGAKIDEQINRCLYSFQKARDNCFYPARCDPRLIRICVDPGKDPRHPSQVSSVELVNAMRLVLSKALSLEQDELFTRTLDIFGIGRLLQDYRPFLHAALQALVQDNAATMQHGTIEYRHAGSR